MPSPYHTLSAAVRQVISCKEALGYSKTANRLMDSLLSVENIPVLRTGIYVETM